MQNLKEDFSKLKEKTESNKSITKKKKVSKWKETCKLIERYIPEYLLKRFLEYY
jgi:hypothetical protein